MKIRVMIMSALPVMAVAGIPGWAGSGSLAVVAKVQDPSAKASAPSTGGLARVARDDEENPSAFDQDAWRKKLAAADLSEREKAFEDLAGMARKDRDIRKTLQDWAKDEKNSDLAWTSRLLLREVDRNGRNGWLGTSRLGPRMRNGFGPGLNWDDFSRRFSDFDSMFGDLRAEWGDLLRSMPPPSTGSRSSSQSLTLQSGPDGVTCTVTEMVDGKEGPKQVYTAKSMDELLAAHPELRESLGSTHFQGWPWDPQGGMRTMPRGLSRLFPRADTQDDSSDITPDEGPRTDRLGVMCSEVDQARASELGLGAGEGLQVEAVQPGTIASVLGLQSGDVVIEVNGTTIHSRDDVKKALAERAPAADVAVVLALKDGHRRTLTWKPMLPADKKVGSRSL